MRISVQESGGFAGLTSDVAAVDTASLDASKAQQIEAAVRDTGFFSLPSNVGESLGFDKGTCRVTIVDGGRQHTVSYPKYDESPATASLRRLVSALHL